MGGQALAIKFHRSIRKTAKRLGSGKPPEGKIRRRVQSGPAFRPTFTNEDFAVGAWYFAETTTAERASSLVQDDERIVILSAIGLGIPDEPNTADSFVIGEGADEESLAIQRVKRIRPADVTLGYRIIVES